MHRTPESPASAAIAQRAVDAAKAHMAQGRHKEALRDYLHAVALMPQVAALHAVIGDVYLELKDPKNAIDCYTKALHLEPSNPAFWNNLGNILRAHAKYKEAASAYNMALKQAPNHPKIWKNLGLCHQYENESEEAIRCMQKAESLAPNTTMYMWHTARVLPITYTSSQQQQRFRDHYTKGLMKVRECTQHDPDHTAIWDAFHLHYQGQNDRALQHLHGTTIHGIMKRALPQFVQPLPKRTRAHRRLRVGFASSMLHKHTITFLFGSWISGLSDRDMDVYGYLIGAQQDATTRALAAKCHTFRSIPKTPEVAAQIIKEDELDVLIYPELGMNRHLLKLAALRLAPLQAVTWGHPVTTGLPTIDVFLSSEAMEPENGAEHYTERLVPLPKLSLWIDSLPAPPHLRCRSDFHLPEDAVLYLIPQSLYKLTPEHDWVYAEIARRVPDAHFCFIANAAAQSSSGAIDTVRRRLEAVFSSVSGSPRFTFLPGQSHGDFLALNACADIFLDAPGWSGGRTTLEALGCGLLPITHAGPMMRQRHTAGILKEMGWDDCVAETIDDYVALAAHAGSNAQWREQKRAELPLRRSKLFGHTEVLDALEQFCQTGCR